MPQLRAPACGDRHKTPKQAATQDEVFAAEPVAHESGSQAIPTELLASTSGHYTGVGIELAATPRGLEVVRPIERSPAERAGVRETVRQKLTQIRDRILKGESFEAIGSVTSEDPGSAATGGDLGWAGPGTFVPAFEAVVDALQVDEISQPIKTDFGWHIVQLLGRRTYDATEDVVRNRCVAQLRESKSDEEVEIWARRLRDDAFVEYHK